MIKRFFSILTTIAVLFSATAFASGSGMIDPKGLIAHQERTLMFDTMALMLIVVMPVIIMSFAFAYRFRASKRRGQYKPEWSHHAILECIWWGVPTIIIVILGVIVWQKSHQLDPYKKIPISGQVEKVETVALQWKWLFIYPDEGIATINDLYLPAGKQVEFFISADAPMSSFGIPQLVGQIYAMAGMRTRLHLYTTHLGVYDGLNTQLNGDGFSFMHFPVHVVEQADFNQWVDGVKASKNPLTINVYAKLYQPTMDAPAVHYSSVTDDLFNKIMMQYMKPHSWLHG